MSLYAQDNCRALLPMPNQVVTMKGKAFSVREGKSTIYTNHESLTSTAEQLKGMISKEMRVNLSLSTQKNSPIQLIVDKNLDNQADKFGTHTQHYQLEVRVGSIRSAKTHRNST